MTFFIFNSSNIVSKIKVPSLIVSSLSFFTPNSLKVLVSSAFKISSALIGVASATSIADCKIVDRIFLILIVFYDPSLIASKVISFIK
jgi:hypothetical protein